MNGRKRILRSPRVNKLTVASQALKRLRNNPDVVGACSSRAMDSRSDSTSRDHELKSCDRAACGAMNDCPVSKSQNLTETPPRSRWNLRCASPILAFLQRPFLIGPSSETQTLLDPSFTGTLALSYVTCWLHAASLSFETEF